MKIEVGKKYIPRNRSDILYIYITGHLDGCPDRKVGSIVYKSTIINKTNPYFWDPNGQACLPSIDKGVTYVPGVDLVSQYRKSSGKFNWDKPKSMSELPDCNCPIWEGCKCGVMTRERELKKEE